jgi:selenocysteine lyase/cysteine desulfurase
MKISRRNFLSAAGISIAANALHTTHILASANPSGDPQNWSMIRDQFDLGNDHIHLASFFLSSHPRPVREAIERYRKSIDRNPFQVVEHGLFGSGGESMTDKVKKAAAEYLVAKPEEIALTGNTTTGLALIYQGLKLKPDQEILTTTHDHYSHHESIRLAAEKAGASVKKIALFDSYDSISEDSIVERIRNGIRDRTRAIGITWVHSSSGLKLPIRKIADAIRDFNNNRDDSDRLLLIVDGVHGLGVENETVDSLGMDFLAAGTHKWIFGPRGTGIIWGRESNWTHLRPTIPTFDSFEPVQAWMSGQPSESSTRASWISPGGFHAYEHQWAMADAFRYHLQIGKQKIAGRIHSLNSLCKEGLASIPGVKLYTPKGVNLSAGIICFDVDGKKPDQVVQYLLTRKIVASTTPYAVSYARVAPSLVNTPEEIERTLIEIRKLANS